MKKLVVCLFALWLSASAFAQTTPNTSAKEEVSITTETVYEELKPEDEASKFADMMAETTEITEEQKKEIYKIALKTMKKKKELAKLRDKDEAKFTKEENQLFQDMNTEINGVFRGN